MKLTTFLQGATWSAAKLILQAPGYFVLNNDRVIQTSKGGLIVPLAFSSLARDRSGIGGAKQTIPRSNIREMKRLDRSLMPVGLEAAISKEQMADLLAFLLGR